MLGIIIAMESEIDNNFINEIDIIEKHKIGIFSFIKFSYSNKESILCFSGIGKANSASATTLLINKFNVNEIINIGSAGIYSNLNVGDIFVGNAVSYGDVDVTGFGYKINQVPKMPEKYMCNNEMINKIKDLLKTDNKSGIVYTIDSFINSNNYQNFFIEDNNLPVMVEMECCSIAQICYIHNIPFSFIKVGIDKIHFPEKNEIQFNKNLYNVANIINSILKKLIHGW